MEGIVLCVVASPVLCSFGPYLSLVVEGGLSAGVPLVGVGVGAVGETRRWGLGRVLGTHARHAVRGRSGGLGRLLVPRVRGRGERGGLLHARGRAVAAEGDRGGKGVRQSSGAWVLGGERGWCGGTSVHRVSVERPLPAGGVTVAEPGRGPQGDGKALYLSRRQWGEGCVCGACYGVLSTGGRT